MCEGGLFWLVLSAKANKLGPLERERERIPEIYFKPLVLRSIFCILGNVTYWAISGWKE